MRTVKVLSILVAFTLFVAFSGNNLKYPQGAPAGYTGSPADAKNCTDCHNGSATSVTGWITSDVPADGYTPGVTYNITVTVSGSGAKGFEVSPQATDGTLLGTLIAGTGSKLVGTGGKYVTQTSSSSANPKTWTFKWQAPGAGTGSVTFYGAFTVSKPVTKLSTLVIPEKVNTSIVELKELSFRLYPNPARDLVELSYTLRERETIKIEILNTTGTLIKSWRTENQEAGDQVQSIYFGGTVPPGLYLVRLTAGSAMATKKLIVL